MTNPFGCFGCCTCLCGVFVLFPGAIVFTGWNEKTAVCRSWAIQGAESQAVTLSCANHSTDIEGTPVSAGQLGFLSCAINQSTFKTFTENDFTGLETLPNLFASADAPAGVAAAAMTMTASMWQCKEECERMECPGARRLDAGEHNFEGSSSSSSSHDDEKDDEPRSRRLGKGGGGAPGGGEAADSCEEVCVEWSYSRALLPQVPPVAFNNWAGAEAVCGNLSYPYADVPVKLGTSDVHASAGSVKTSPGNSWSLNELQMEWLPMTHPVVLRPRAAPSGVNFTTIGPSKLTLANTIVEENVVKTCGSTQQRMGCVEIQFYKAAPAHATMLGAVDTIPGQMSKQGWDESKYWACKGSPANHIDRFCPSRIPDDMHKGDQTCGEDVDTMDEMIALMRNANWERTMLFRLLAFVLIWCSVNSCFQPIESALQFATDMMDDATDCIPCVGCAVEFLTDLFMGMVKSILCVVSCCCTIALFLSVVAVMWLVMRPMLGSVLAVVACCFCSGAVVMLKMCGSKAKGDWEDISGDEEYADNEDIC